jgi:hypothetical protein
LGSSYYVMHTSFTTSFDHEDQQKHKKFLTEI